MVKSLIKSFRERQISGRRENCPSMLSAKWPIYSKKLADFLLLGEIEYAEGLMLGGDQSVDKQAHSYSLIQSSPTKFILHPN